jgi:OmpA-OmpF porin, OOP family
MRLTTYLPVTFAIAMAAGLSVLAATVAVDKIELRTRDDLTQALRIDGFDWAEVRVDGLQAILSGTAPDEAARFGALATAGEVVDATRILNRMEVNPGQTIEAPEFSVEILRNVDGISLIGLIPAASDREAVIERLGALSKSPVSDLLEVGDYPMPETWDPAMAFALDALDKLPRSKVSVTAEQVAITGIVESEQRKRQVETELARMVPSDITLDLDIAAPRPVIAPFTARFLKDKNGVRFDACAADTPEARDTIVNAGREAGAQGAISCQIGLGAPSLDWGEAVAAGIGTVKNIGAGTVTYSDSDVSLVVPHTIPLPAFDRAVGELERALPDGFSLTAVRSSPPPEASGGETESEETPEFVATLSPEGQAQLRGRLSSERERTVIDSYAEALFGAEATDQAARLDDSLPDGWSLRVMAGLDALAYLSHGVVRVGPDTMSLSGKTGREDAAAEIAGLLSERLEDGADYEIDVVYEEALDPLSGLPTPEECVKKLNTVLAVQKITFEPGSAEIDQSGVAIIDQLAEILRDCQTVQMEIGGHTDSQGREVMNTRLSQERADAVLTAIMARRVLTSNLTAKGYGEASPIADNDTEEGREANRRIEFTLRLPDEEAETADAGEADDAGAAEEDANEQN